MNDISVFVFTSSCIIGPVRLLVLGSCAVARAGLEKVMLSTLRDAKPREEDRENVSVL